MGEKAIKTVITEVNWELWDWRELQPRFLPFACPSMPFVHRHLLITFFHSAPHSLERTSFLQWCQFMINIHKGMTISVARPSGYWIFHHSFLSQENHQLPCFYRNWSCGDNSWLRWTVSLLLKDSLWGSASTGCTCVPVASVLGTIYSSSSLLLVFSFLRHLGNQTDFDLGTDNSLFHSFIQGWVGGQVDGWISGSFSHSKACIEYLKIKSLCT